MKNNLLKLFVGVFALAFMFAACKKDDDAELKNRITYDGQSYDLVKGYICDLTTIIKATGYQHAIFLASKNIVMPTYAPPMGTGNWAGFWISSSSDSEIVPGTYTFAGIGSEEFTFHGEIMLESSYSMSKSLPNTDITGGTIEISRNGDIYEFNFQGTIGGGQPVKAYYKGHVITLINEIIMI